LAAPSTSIVGTHDDTLGTRPTLAILLEAAKAMTGSDATFVHASDEFIAAQGDAIIGQSLPFYGSNLFAISNAKAVVAGLLFRPLDDTIAAGLTSAAPATAWVMPKEVKADIQGRTITLPRFLFSYQKQIDKIYRYQI
jgi:hypothetical protein